MRSKCNSSLIYLENSRGEYLMLHRVKKKNDINHDKWIGVGGGFEHGESPEECALRETREETGLTLTDCRFRGIVTFDCEGQETLYMHLFTASGWTGELTDCDEGELEWVPKEKVYDLPIWEGDKIFFRLLEQERPFFSLKLSYDRGDVLRRAVLDGEELARGGKSCWCPPACWGRTAGTAAGTTTAPRRQLWGSATS